MATADKGVARRARTRVTAAGAGELALDDVAIEEPLEIRVAGDSVAITMRTPGDDARLAMGFLIAEGIIRSIDELGSVAPCGRPGEEGYGNAIDCVPAAGVVLDVERAQASRRGTLTTSACGVCGRRSVDDLLSLCTPLPAGVAVAWATLVAAMEQLRDRQAIFARTGGTHAAAAFAANGALLAAHEDVGRHNAVDKVVGALAYQRQLGEAAILAVSGRCSFEIVQKAAVARIPVVASVSAASTLAIDLAERSGIALVAFVRVGAMSVYAHPERIRG